MVQMLQEAIEVLAIEDGEGVVYVVFPIPRLVGNDKVITSSSNSKHSMNQFIK